MAQTGPSPTPYPARGSQTLIHLLKRSRLTYALVACVSFLVLGSCWALNSPVGSSPDDDFHLTTIWCQFGDRQSACSEVGSDPKVVNVPASVALASQCYRFQPDVSGSCAEEVAGIASGVSRVNDGEYPGMFYTSMALFVGPDVKRSVIAMRVVNVLLASVLIFAALTVPSRSTSRAFALSFSVVLIPLGIFLVGSTNPSGWTFIGAATFWVFLTSWLQMIRRVPPLKSTVILILLVFSAVLLIGARSDGALLALTVCLAAAILHRDDRTSERDVALLMVRWLPIVFTAIAAVVVLISTTQIGMATGGESDRWQQGTQAVHPVNLLVQNLQDLPTLVVGAVGGSGLGWLDTLMPSIVYVTNTLLIGALILIGLNNMWKRKGVAIILLLLATLGPPLLLLQINNHFVGSGVQPRYLLPGLVALLGFLLISHKHSAWPVNSVFRWTFVTALVLTTAVAFWVSAMRYALPDGWSMFGGLPPIRLTFVATLSAAGFFVAISHFFLNEFTQSTPRSRLTTS